MKRIIQIKQSENHCSYIFFLNIITNIILQFFKTLMPT